MSLFGFLRSKKSDAELEDEAEDLERELSIIEKRALLKEAKKRYGKDFNLHVPKFLTKSGGGSGMDWKALRFKMQ